MLIIFVEKAKTAFAKVELCIGVGL